jgi:long-chain acyl-CoA synthetase
MRTLPELVWQSARRYADRPALGALGAPQEEISYAQLARFMVRGAGLLHTADLRPGDRVLLFCESGPAWPAALFAILAGGQVAVPLPADTPLATAARIAAFAEARAAFVSSRTQDLATLASGLVCLPVQRLFDGESPAGTPEPQPGLALLAFTSGSTSQPRAVELTHANLLANLEAMLQVRQAGPGDAFLSMLPPAHLFELLVGQLGPLACGARIVYARALLPHRLIAALREVGITHALSVPALLDALYQEILDELAEAGVIDPARRGQSPAETASILLLTATVAEMKRLRAGLRSRIGATFHSLFVGGAALDPAWERLAVLFGLHLEVGYGLTEASPIVCSGRAGACPPGSVGRPLPGVEVRIDANEEVLVRGPNVMRGFFKDPAATAAALADGWLRTGDRGRLDADGFLFITGRLKEAMVTAAGDTIYPEEVEPYYASPLFAEWCVAALPGPQGNDVPTLFVVPAAPELPEHALKQAFECLRAAAPARFRLHGMHRLGGPLPRTATGKIRRRLLAQQWPQRS